jgi:hypothetical protein
MTHPELRAELPKPDICATIERTLAQLKLFADANPWTYARPGVEHIPAVVTYLAWVRNNQHQARRVE